MDDAEQKRNLYASACGFEDKLDADAEAARRTAFKESHVRCINNHVRPKSEDCDDKCPVCGSCVPYFLDDSQVPNFSAQ